MKTGEIFLESSIKQFESYKKLGEKAITQIPDDKLNWQPNAESNSIATIVNHLSGNMLSRWTDFLTSDGEKEWRKRDEEFENSPCARVELTEKWNIGWDCVLKTLKSLNSSDLEKTVLIRNEKHTVIDAMNRQLAHYAYHIGQITYLAKIITNEKWVSLSIPKNKTKDFNAQMFSKPNK